MGKIAVPKAPTVKQITMPRFLGADLTNAPSYVSDYRSPNCPNMIRESAGKVRKWIGYHTIRTYDDQINGFHNFPNGDGTYTLLVHAGEKLYNGNTVLYSGMNDSRSVSKLLNKQLVIADGKKMLKVYMSGGNITVRTLESSAYAPTVVISRRPTGGGTTYEPINLLGNTRIDSFLGTANDTVYQLSATGISAVTKVEKLKSDGTWETVASSGYSVNTTTGKVTFSGGAPGVSPIAGQDNIKITFTKTVSGYADKINKCDIMTLYGVNGSMDRIFARGSTGYPNRDYYCQMDDPSYWGDIWYSIIGQDDSTIMGYSIIGNVLATHIDHSDSGTNIILRAGSLADDGTVAFRQTGAYQGTGAISKWAYANLETEPLFLTRHGIMAVTPSDVIGERFRQLRSYYLNGLLLEQDLTEAVACTYERFYMVSAGGYLFRLDGTQASVEENEPYSKRQYEGFYRTNVNARCIVNIDDTLIFGTADGEVKQFYKDYDEPAYFNDDGDPIEAVWSTPELYGKNFYYKKRFKLLSALVGAAIVTSVQVTRVYDGETEVVIDYGTDSRYFTFSHIQFSKLTFKTDKTAYIIREKISIKPESRKVQFIFENRILNEPFALYEAAIEYTEAR
jgi:hypothetical protein